MVWNIEISGILPHLQCPHSHHERSCSQHVQVPHLCILPLHWVRVRWLGHPGTLSFQVSNSDVNFGVFVLSDQR